MDEMNMPVCFPRMLVVSLTDALDPDNNFIHVSEIFMEWRFKNSD